MDWLDVIFMICDCGEWWRFALCLFGSIVAAAFICDRLTGPARAVVSVPLIAAGAIGGAVWEYRAGKQRW